jgi:hypothetical protein
MPQRQDPADSPEDAALKTTASIVLPSAERLVGKNEKNLSRPYRSL